MVGSLANDNEDVWVKSPEKMSADFIHFYNNDSSSTIFFPISKNQPPIELQWINPKQIL